MNHMTNQFLTRNTAFFDESVESLKRESDDIPHNRTRGSRDNSRSGEQDRISSMDRRSQNDSRETHEADIKTTHEISETHTCLRAIDRRIAMIHARDMDNDTIPENLGRNNKTNRFDLSHLAMTGKKPPKHIFLNQKCTKPTTITIPNQTK